MSARAKFASFRRSERRLDVVFDVFANRTSIRVDSGAWRNCRTTQLILAFAPRSFGASSSVLTDSEQLFASKYLPYLPSETELQNGQEEHKAIGENLDRKGSI